MAISTLNCVTVLCYSPTFPFAAVQPAAVFVPSLMPDNHFFVWPFFSQFWSHVWQAIPLSTIMLNPWIVDWSSDHKGMQSRRPLVKVKRQWFWALDPFVPFNIIQLDHVCSFPHVSFTLSTPHWFDGQAVSCVTELNWQWYVMSTILSTLSYSIVPLWSAKRCGVTEEARFYPPLDGKLV